MKQITEVYPEGSLEFWRDKSEKLNHRVWWLERQLESIYCSFCGERFEISDADGITQHIRVCEKHPMRATESQVAALTAELQAANEDAEAMDEVIRQVEEFYTWYLSADSHQVIAQVVQRKTRIISLCEKAHASHCARVGAS